MQIAAVVDSFQGQDPFEGDGHMAKGRYMQVQGDTSSSAVLQEYLQAMTAYRFASSLILWYSSALKKTAQLH